MVGRIQLRYRQGLWNEWYLLFENQRSGWLGEMLGNYVVTFIVQPLEPLPPFSELRAGHRITLQGRDFQVTNIENARCIAGEGELPIRVGPGYEAGGGFAGQRRGIRHTDYSENPPLALSASRAASTISS